MLLLEKIGRARDNFLLTVIGSDIDDEALAESSVTASAGGQGRAGNGLAAGTRSVGVAASALQGFDGVLQLNQIAGAGNDTANILGMAVHGNP